MITLRRIGVGLLVLPLVLLSVMLLDDSSAEAAPATFFWTDWTDGDFTSGFVGQGTITTPTSVVDVTYTNPQGIHFFQSSGGIDYYANNVFGCCRDPLTSPYTGDVVANIPTGTDIVALRYAGSQTLTFSEEIANPVFSYVSLNGNGYGFDQDFEILSFGDPSDGNDCGYWGCGTSFKNVVDLGGGNFEYQLLGTGEPHGTIRFLGAFSTVTWRSLSDEIWNGFTVGVQGTAIEIPDTDFDGILDEDDLCPGTPAGEPVDANGCTAPPSCGIPTVDVWDSSDPDNFVLLGQIETIRTAETGAAHYDYGSASAHPSDVNVDGRHANIWVHQNTNNDDLTFGFVFGEDDSGVIVILSDINFRIVDSDTDPFVSQSDDPGEAVESPAGSNAFLGTFRYGNNTDGIAVSGISGGGWTIIVDSVSFGVHINEWFASNGSASGFGDDLALTLGNEYRLTPACSPPADVPVTILDEDEDGVIDELDLCPGTPAGEPVDANGCSPSQLNAPPDCSNAAPSVDSLWPPNHKFKTIAVTGVTDPDAGDTVSITIDSIMQDEPVNGKGDGKTSPDGLGVGSDSAEVRAERSGKGNGRVYVIGYTADDGNGGTCSATVEVGVPHDKKDTALNDGAAYDSTES
ncbi:MAG: hypothetical protein O3A47_08240 [Chloroflexi bacterium]|nr:hypothetical protein [Chloroflexota bacterium]